VPRSRNRNFPCDVSGPAGSRIRFPRRRQQEKAAVTATGPGAKKLGNAVAAMGSFLFALPGKNTGSAIPQKENLVLLRRKNLISF
jgi:hypothetical protein